MEEIWVPLVGVENVKRRYEVSNLGRLRYIYARGSDDSWRIAKQHVRVMCGRQRVLVNLVAKTFTIRSLGVLVAKAFVPNPNGYMFVDYIDGNPLNCRADNIVWVKRLEPRNKVPIHQYTMDGKFVAEYVIAVDAGAAAGTKSYDVHKSCKNEPGKFTAGGFIWRFATDTEFSQMPEAERAALIYKNWHSRPSTKNRGKAVRQYSFSGVFIREYASASVAARALDLHSCSISNVCRRLPQHKSCGGYLWRYPDDDEFDTQG